MFDWITHNKGLFLNSYTEIGTSHPHAMELQTQHNHFAMNCMVSVSACTYPACESVPARRRPSHRPCPSTLPGGHGGLQGS